MQLLKTGELDKAQCPWYYGEDGTIIAKDKLDFHDSLINRLQMILVKRFREINEP